MAWFLLIEIDSVDGLVEEGVVGRVGSRCLGVDVGASHRVGQLVGDFGLAWLEVGFCRHHEDDFGGQRDAEEVVGGWSLDEFGYSEVEYLAAHLDDCLHRRLPNLVHEHPSRSC